jgi:hypothetical protein
MNFGEAGQTKAIKINYSKGNDGGKIAIILGEHDEEPIATITLAYTGGWDKMSTAVVGLPEDISGTHNITIKALEGWGVMDLYSFELSPLTERADPLPTIAASEFGDSKNMRLNLADMSMITHFGYNGDYVTYDKINFGAEGTTKGMKLTYSKHNNGGKLVVRVGGPDGTVLAAFNPAHTSGWSSANSVDAYLAFDSLVPLSGV